MAKRTGRTAHGGLRRLDVRRLPGKAAAGLILGKGLALRCALGRGGLSALKREGDGATPLARLRLLGGFVRPVSMRMAARLPLREIRPDLGWCDAPGDRNYNRPVRLPYAASHERMWRADSLYDVCLVLDWNIRPRRRNAGSAIFLHLARPGYAPTEGCIAVSRADMRRLLPLVSNRTVLKVIG
jgi:L,D-peptidoglycan transpeptidase YkuD (ErfK/YbiS/YcfS/YnhG family)